MDSGTLQEGWGQIRTHREEVKKIGVRGTRGQHAVGKGESGKRNGKTEKKVANLMSHYLNAQFESWKNGLL